MGEVHACWHTYLTGVNVVSFLCVTLKTWVPCLMGKMGRHQQTTGELSLPVLRCPLEGRRLSSHRARGESLQIRSESNAEAGDVDKNVNKLELLQTSI